MKATEVAIGWTAADDSFLSRSIRYFTRPELSIFSRAEWSHMLLCFRLEDGYYVIYEALGNKGWATSSSQNLSQWYNADPSKHHLQMRWLKDVSADDAEHMHLIAQSFLGMVSYAWKQILLCALVNTYLGRKFKLARFLQDTKDGVICSELAPRIVAQIAPKWDLRMCATDPWDYLTPQQAWENYLKLEKLYGN